MRADGLETKLEELTTHCIRCGFCLEACPTFTTTASELESPRGRIYLVRSAVEGKLQWQDDVKEHLDRCLGCRACETACPSGVEYGAILELARDHIEKEVPNRAKSILLEATTRPTWLRLQLALSRLWPGKRLPSFVSKFVAGHGAEVDIPKPQRVPTLPELSDAQMPPLKGEVYLLEGCAMRVLYPTVHLATRRLLRRVGFAVREVDQGCCGALHAHNGHLGEARKFAAQLIAAMPGDLPVVVNSAGCGSAMKEYDELMVDSSEQTEAFRMRVADLSQFLFLNGLTESLEGSPGYEATLTYHDACHLAHGQSVRSEPRRLLQAIPRVKFVELGEADTCCGSAGIYNVTQPQLARTMLERKWSNVADSHAAIVATGNPGCHAWIAQAAREKGGSVSVLHTAEALEAAYIGLSYFQ